MSSEFAVLVSGGIDYVQEQEPDPDNVDDDDVWVRLSESNTFVEVLIFYDGNWHVPEGF